MSGSLRAHGSALPRTKTAREAEKADLVFEVGLFQFFVWQLRQNRPERLAHS
jgi:hypothetical protein